MAKTETPVEAIQEEQAVKEPEAERRVRVRLPIIPGVEKQEAVFVGCNDRSWVIPRGVETEVPECVAEILRNSEDMQFAAMEYIAANNKE